jgi:hypothetical protein
MQRGRSGAERPRPRTEGSARADATFQTSEANFDANLDELLYGKMGACATSTAWQPVTAPFTAVASFIAPAAPMPANFTVWQSGAARLYVLRGALALDWGQNTITGGTLVTASATVSVAAGCSSDAACFIM